VSGIGPALARAIVEHRSAKGLFRSRSALLDVPRFGDRAFEQAAGFLRIPNGENPLDNTGVHPERYQLLDSFAAKQGKDTASLLGSGVDSLKKNADLKSALGDFTFKDIIQELEKPGRDPRSQFEIVKFREDIHELSDLKPGMVCTGIVTNVTNFGAFVDIGVHQDGLVHISQLADTFVKDPRSVVSPGDKVMVRVLDVNIEKRQIALTMKKESDAQTRPAANSRPSSSDRGERGQGKRSYESPALINNPFANLGSMLSGRK
jgi:uncharacterized protein